jgi:hypothetical protein
MPRRKRKLLLQQLLARMKSKRELLLVQLALVEV